MADLIFKSEKERADAMNAVPEVDDAPPNTNLDEFRMKIDQDLTDIQNATINPEGAPAVEPNADAVATLPVEEPVTDPIVEPTMTPEESELVLLRNRNEALERERNDRESLHNAKMQEFEDKLKEIESKNTPINLKTDNPKTSTDHQILAIQEEIDKLEEVMNDPEADVYDESYIKNLRKQGSLNSKLNRIIRQTQTEQAELHKAELTRVTNEQNLKKKNLQKEETHNKVLGKIAKFREGKPEFAGLDYGEMDQQYTEFSKKIAEVWHGKPASDLSNAQTELAMDQYLKGTPALMEAAKNRGLKEPVDMHKFITLSEINATRMGYSLNKISGKWEQMKDEYGNNVNFPNHDAAYNYIKSSTRGQDLLKAQNSAAKGILKAVNTRANPVELNDSHLGDNVQDMTKEEAHNILAKFDEQDIELKRRRDFNDPMVIEYNKALVTLGHTPLAND